MPTDLLEEINKAENLDELSSSMYSYIQANKPILPPTPEAEFIPDVEEDGPTDEELEVIEMEHFIKVNEIKPFVREIPKVVDDILITHDSLANISSDMDSIDKYKKLHSSILALQDYLRTNMKDIQEYHSDDCDIAFKGLWHDGTNINVQSFSLSDAREHSAWYINILSSEI
jgi:hypothetical protein